MNNQRCTTHCLQQALRRNTLTSWPLWAATTFGGAGGTQKAPKGSFLYFLPSWLLFSSTLLCSLLPGGFCHQPVTLSAPLPVHPTKSPKVPMCITPRAAIMKVNYHCTTLCCWLILELGILEVWIYFMPSYFLCLQLMHFTGELSSQVKKPGRFGPPRGWSCSPEYVTGTNHLNSERSVLDPAMWFYSVPLRAACKPSPKTYLLYKTEDEKKSAK